MTGVGLHVQVKTTTFLRKVHNLQGRFVDGHQRMKVAHQLAIDWLTDETIKNLNASATRRAHDTRHERLAQVLRDPSINQNTASGFKFIVHDRMKKANARVAAYYRVIEGGPGSEYGRYYWIHRTEAQPFGLFFFGPGGARGQQGRGSWVKPFPQVHITTPQPAYHYIERAVEEFTRQGKYREFALRALREAKVPVK